MKPKVTFILTMLICAGNFNMLFAQNKPPQITLDGLIMGMEHYLSYLPLFATASDPDGEIIRVEFYAGNGKAENDHKFIGEGRKSINNTYVMIWNDIKGETYYIFAVAYDNNGGVAITEPVFITVYNRGASFQNPIIINSLFNSKNNGYYSDTRNNDPANYYGNHYGQPSHDVVYEFYVEENAKYTISLCNEGEVNFDTYLHLLDSDENVVATNDDNGPICNSTKSSMVKILPPGFYNVVVEGFGKSFGNYKLEITAEKIEKLPDGATFDNPIDLGFHTSTNVSIPLNYINTSLANNYGDAYSISYGHGQNSDDVICRIVLDREYSLNINTCESDFDTYIHVLNSDKQEIGYNDDNGPTCDPSRQASLVMGLDDSETEDPDKGKFKSYLAPGTYYIVFEGFGSYSGNLKANINLTTKSGARVNMNSESVGLIDRSTQTILAPNPASEKFTLTLPEEGQANIELFNMTGVCLKKLRTAGIENNIDVSDLDQGLYMVRIVQGQTIISKLLKVQR